MRSSTNSLLPELPNYGSFFAQLGRGVPALPDSAPIRHESVFQQLLLDMMGNQSPTGFSQIKRVLYQAMIHFRRMKNDDLTGGFAELQRVRLTITTLPTEARQATEAMLLPMLAYYYFRTGDYPVARAYNQQAVLLSSKLQTSYPILHLHQIQQHINLCRIDLDCHTYSEGLSGLKELIDYLVMGRLPRLSGSWSQALWAGLDPGLRSQQLLVILDELVFAALRLTELETAIPDAVLTDVGRTLTQQPMPGPSPESALWVWWQSYQHRAEAGSPLFLANVLDLLTRYPAPYDQLKLLLLGRLHHAAAKPATATADQLRLLRRFVNTNLKLSPRLLAHIRALRNPAIADSQPTF